MIWLLLMVMASAQAELTQAFRLITPRLLAAAIAIKIAFVIVDKVPQKATAITLIILVMAMEAAFCVMIDGSSQSLNIVIIQECVNITTATCVAFALRYGMNTLRVKRITRHAELQKKLAEQRALNARLTPHVLYNMLNAIYAASLRDPDKSSQLILSLASMMRHLTDSTDKDFVDAESELSFIRNFAQLSQEQMDAQAKITLHFPQSVDIQVPNLLCVTLFENAVTHSKTLATTPEIIATFKETESGFVFTVTNHIDKVPTTTHQHSNAIHTGVASVRQRLAYLYPDRHQFNAGVIGDNCYRAEIITW